ncbi:MAG: methane monooxygenase/ammonia monooxygenase subunit B [Vitreoscilla sp.]|jgi:methane/ammonia monooxygenase subunit B|nr:methane monooxygenase/ammonia monooxygenase subunit B [Vitreoscilla sp.]
MSAIKDMVLRALLWICVAVGCIPVPALAHGERSTEPYIRTRSLHWYDVTWSADKVKVNESVIVEGKFRVFSDWPDAVSKPDLVFLASGAPSAMLVRNESYINELPARQSIKNLELGRDYSFKLVMRGRVPGKWHLHPMLNISGAGPVIGPGSWVEVAGNAADFRESVTTLHGTKIDDLQNYGVARAQAWQAGYALIAVAWLLWWLRRPLIIPRWRALERGREDLLVTTKDDKVAVGLLVLVLAVVIVGFTQTQKDYPQLVPLQAGVGYTPPLPEQPTAVAIKFKRAEYDVPGRTMRVTAEFTNKSDKPQRIGEFTTAGLRFVNKNLPAAVAAVDPKFPKELVPANGLRVDKDAPLQPGEKRVVTIDASDAAWEVERLVSFLTNVDARTGGLVFFYDDSGKRSIGEVFGPILPVFKGVRL